MELTLTQENFSKALNAVGRVASTKTQLPILGNILLRTDGARLLVAATNLEIAVTEYIGAKIAKHGSITVPAKLITEFVANLPKGPVDLKLTGNNLHISSGSYASIINGVISDEFPELPTIQETAAISYEIATEDFKKAVGQTIITTSNDSTRPVLTGVYWHTVDKKLVLAATDGYRLSERILMDVQSELHAIIPTQTLQEVLRNINDSTDQIDVLFDETQVRFRIDTTEIISRLIDGNFPDYKQLMPSNSETKITVSKDEFVRVIKIASLFARESGGSITINATKESGLLSIHSIASQLGENTSETTATITNDGQVTLNSRYIAEALQVIDGNEIHFEFNGKLSPCLFYGDIKQAEYRHIIMPLKS